MDKKLNRIKVQSKILFIFFSLNHLNFHLSHRYSNIPFILINFDLLLPTFAKQKISKLKKGIKKEKREMIDYIENREHLAQKYH